MKFSCAFLATCAALALVLPTRAADLPNEIRCEGGYPAHLQGVATDGEFLYWSFTVEVVRTDLSGRRLATTGPVPEHHGDLCVVEGVVYVAVNLGKFNHLDKGIGEVRAYDAKTLKPLRTWKIPELVHGAGGMTYANGRFFVIGGLPAVIEENYVYEYDREFRFLRRHTLKSGFTLMGIQTADYADGRFLFGIYGDKGNPAGVLVSPADLSSVVRRTGPGNVGILKLNGVYWTGRTFRNADKTINYGSLVRADGYPESNPVYGPDPTGKGVVRIFYEGRDRTGWQDAGYQIEPNGYKAMSNANAYVPVAKSAETNEYPAAGIGGTRAYFVPDVLRGVHRAARHNEVFSLHVPGTPETVVSDAKLSETLRAVRAEAKRLGVKVCE